MAQNPRHTTAVTRGSGQDPIALVSRAKVMTVSATPIWVSTPSEMIIRKKMAEKAWAQPLGREARPSAQQQRG